MPTFFTFLPCTRYLLPTNPNSNIRSPFASLGEPLYYNGSSNTRDINAIDRKVNYANNGTDIGKRRKSLR